MEEENEADRSMQLVDLSRSLLQFYDHSFISFFFVVEEEMREKRLRTNELGDQKEENSKAENRSNRRWKVAPVIYPSLLSFRSLSFLSFCFFLLFLFLFLFLLLFLSFILVALFILLNCVHL